MDIGLRVRAGARLQVTSLEVHMSQTRLGGDSLRRSINIKRFLPLYGNRS